MNIKSIKMGSMLYLTAVFGMLYMLVSGAAVAGTITGSKHDLAKYTGAGAEICVVCHTPHNSDSSVTDAPLWNHTLSVTAQADYIVYASGTLDGDTTGGPTGISKLCLSCHDGSVAVDSFGGATGTDAAKIGATAETTYALIGTDLSNDHPISFNYGTAASTDGALHPVTTSVVIGDTTADSKTTTIDGLLFNGQLECASCHDVHNKFTVASTRLATNKLLRVTMDKSALCLTCHNK